MQRRLKQSRRRYRKDYFQAMLWIDNSGKVVAKIDPAIDVKGRRLLSYARQLSVLKEKLEKEPLIESVEEPGSLLYAFSLKVKFRDGVSLFDADRLLEKYVGYITYKRW